MKARSARWSTELSVSPTNENLDPSGPARHLDTMFPFRDHNPSERVPFVTIGLLILNVAVYLYLFPLYSDERAIYSVFFDWGLVPGLVTDGRGYAGFVTYAFLHGGFMHLAGNMLFLWVFGDNLEDEMGHIPFLIFYIAAGILAGVTQVVVSQGSYVPVVGASGAVAGIMGGYLLLYPRARVDVFFFFIIFFKIIPIPAWIVLGIWFGVQIINGTSGSADPVAYWAHAGGFIAGFLMVLPLWVRRGAQAFWARSDGHPPHPETKYRLQQSSIPVVRRR